MTQAQPTPFVLDLLSHAATDPSVSGSAAAALSRLSRDGLRVPPGIVLTSAAYAAHVAACPRALRLRVAASEGEGPDEAAIGLARREIARQALPASVAAALRPRLQALLLEGPIDLRPSPTWPLPAGLAEPDLGCPQEPLFTVPAVLDALPGLFAALWRAWDAPWPLPWEEGLALAVVAHLHVPAQLGGWAAPLAPGEAGKPLALRLGADGERAHTQFIAQRDGQPLAGAAGQGQQLAPAQARLLADAYRRAEARLGFPQEMRWALSGGEIFVLGCRPVTRLPERWLRAPLADRFPEALTPLTWDLLADGYAHAFQAATRQLGLPPIAAPWLSCVDGWVRLNQTLVDLSLARLEPGWDTLAGLQAQLPDWALRFGWLKDLPTQWLAGLDRYLLRLGRLQADPGLAGATPRALWQRIAALRSLGRDFFAPHGLVELGALALRQQLLRLLRVAAGGEQAARLYQDLLLQPEGRIAQTRAELQALRRLAHEAGGRDWLGEGDLRLAWQRGAPPQAAALEARVQAFLAEHGHLANRYDLAEPPWQEAPWLLLAHLRDGRADRLSVQGDEAPAGFDRLDGPDAAARVRRGQAEERLLALVPPELRVFVLDLLRLARLYHELPDLERYQVRRLAGPLRQALLELGGQMQAAGELARADGIFQLDAAAIEAWLRRPRPAERGLRSRPAGGLRL